MGANILIVAFRSSTNDLAARELKPMRAESQRLKAIETGVNTERDPVEHPWLH